MAYTVYRYGLTLLQINKLMLFLYIFRQYFADIVAFLFSLVVLIFSSKLLSLFSSFYIFKTTVAICDHSIASLCPGNILCFLFYANVNVDSAVLFHWVANDKAM